MSFLVGNGLGIFTVDLSKNDKVETYLDSNNIGDDLEHETDLKPG